LKSNANIASVLPAMLGFAALNPTYSYSNRPRGTTDQKQNHPFTWKPRRQERSAGNVNVGLIAVING
jgi:hypothetical protein